MPLHVYYSSKKTWQEVGKKIGYEKVLITFNGFLKDFNIIMIINIIMSNSNFFSYILVENPNLRKFSKPTNIMKR